jgi:hypothetical protein
MKNQRRIIQLTARTIVLHEGMNRATRRAETWKQKHGLPSAYDKKQ